MDVNPISGIAGGAAAGKTFRNTALFSYPVPASAPAQKGPFVTIITKNY